MRESGQAAGAPAIPPWLQVFEQYGRFSDERGLLLAGLQQTYEDGVGDVEVDFAALGLHLSPPEQASCAGLGHDYA